MDYECDHTDWPQCVKDGSLSKREYIDWNWNVCSQMVPKHIPPDMLALFNNRFHEETYIHKTRFHEETDIYKNIENGLTHATGGKEPVYVTCIRGGKEPVYVTKNGETLVKYSDKSRHIAWKDDKVSYEDLSSDASSVYDQSLDDDNDQNSHNINEFSYDQRLTKKGRKRGLVITTHNTQHTTHNTLKRIKHYKTTAVSPRTALKKMREKDKRLCLTTLEKWKRKIHPRIENTTVYTQDGIDKNGPSEIRIEKDRRNTKGKGIFYMWFDGTMAFVFEEFCSGITFKNTKYDDDTRLVMYATPDKEGNIISINAFVNAYSVAAGCGGQKNGKQWLFGVSWRDSTNEHYQTFLRITGDLDENDDLDSI